jgi:hypothetical protein
MKHLINDNDELFKVAFKKLAADVMKTEISVPNDVSKIAEEAYDKRFSSGVNFGDSDMFELARLLKSRKYLPLSIVLDIHKYTVKHRFSHSDSKTHRTYWEWKLYGGEPARKWSESIVRAYIPKEVRS